MPSEPNLASLKKWVNELCKKLLNPYIQRLKSSETALVEGREFNDPIWGTISVTSFESIIIDSPIFQRLRRIKQLGVLHWIYPGAQHTRFEHSIGTLHIIQDFVDSIQNQIHQQIKSETVAELRCAALCHDLGHGMFSHVSEHALEHYEEIVSIKAEFANAHGKESVPYSEIMAILIIESQPFKSLIKTAQQMSHDNTPSVNAAENIKKILLGETIDTQFPHLHELISGPFDADKLDYMRRDTMMSGIPSVIDVTRLVKKVRAVEASKLKLEKINHGSPLEIIINKAKKGDGYLFGLAYAGSRAIDELLIGRILLFDKLYRHQKSRSIDGLIFHAIDSYKTESGKQIYEIPYEQTDEVFVGDGLLIAEIASSEFQAIADRLRNRVLYARAYAFNNIIAGDEPIIEAKISRLLNDLSRTRKFQFLLELAKYIENAAKILKKSKLFEKHPLSTVRRIWIDPPAGIEHASKMNRAILVKNNTCVEMYKDRSKEISKWADAYLNIKELGYLYADQEISEIAHLAFEALLANKYDLLLPDVQHNHIKFDSDDLDEMRDKLIRAQYYKDIPYKLRRLPSLLKSKLEKKEYNSIKNELSSYSPPEINGEKYTIDDNQIAMWLSQFESDGLIKTAYKMLNHLKLVGREDHNKQFKAFLKQYPLFKDATLVGLGAEEDGAGTVAYLLKDSGLNVRSIDEALKENGKIVFVDDFIGLGNKSDNTLSAYLGRSPTNDLKENKPSVLAEALVEKLLDREVAFFFTAGWSKGLEVLKKTCNEAGFKKTSFFIGLKDEELPNLSNIPDTSESEQKKLKTFLRKKAQSIFDNASLTWCDKKKRSRLLGYGNTGLLIFFPFNTPTQTITCLWKSGVADELEWQALIPRREK